MHPRDWIRGVLRPSWAVWLPPRMASPEAEALVTAICLQESDLRHRFEFGGGSGRGYAQFTPAGLAALLSHPRTAPYLRQIAWGLDLEADVAPLWAAIAYQDTLTACAARLALWALPEALPGPSDRDAGWAQYLAAWRPGRPRPERWQRAWAEAWAAVMEADP